MKKIVLSILIIMGVLVITGCDKYDSLKGKWKAPIEYQKVGKEEDYYLECNGKGYYDLTDKSGDLANASYKVSNTKVTFYDEGRQILAICKIKGNELDCSEKSYYSFKYIKVKD